MRVGDWQRLKAVFTGEDVINEKINLAAEGRAKVRKYLKRAFRCVLGSKPRVKKACGSKVNRSHVPPELSSGRASSCPLPGTSREGKG